MSMGSRVPCLDLTKHCAGVVEEFLRYSLGQALFVLYFEKEGAPECRSGSTEYYVEYYFASSKTWSISAFVQAEWLYPRLSRTMKPTDMSDKGYKGHWVKVGLGVQRVRV